MSVCYAHKNTLNRYHNLGVLRHIILLTCTSFLDIFFTTIIHSYINHSLLFNPANRNIAKHYRVQNCSARVVTHSPRLSHSVPILKSLHIAPCALSHYFQELYMRLSSNLIYTTSISIFDANSSKKFQTATLNQ